MAERKKYDPRIVAVGKMITERRKALGKAYRSRDAFIENRSTELFGGNDWISLRHLSSIEEGKNMPSIEMLITLAYALETDPVELFQQIIDILSGKKTK